MSAIKVIKKQEQVEDRIVSPGSPYHRFAVVRICGKKAQRFRAWHKTYADALAVAQEYAADTSNGRGVYAVMEIHSLSAYPTEFERKIADIERNDYENVMLRRATSGGEIIK